MASKLYVGGLSYSTTSDSLREYFGQCGTVESATVITDRMSGDSRGFGFVEMSTEAEAQAAISKLNDQSFEGRKLMVNVAKAPGSGGGCAARWLRGPRRRPAGRLRPPVSQERRRGRYPCAVPFLGPPTFPRIGGGHARRGLPPIPELSVLRPGP